MYVDTVLIYIYNNIIRYVILLSIIQLLLNYRY